MILKWRYFSLKNTFDWFLYIAPLFVIYNYKDDCYSNQVMDDNLNN